MYVFIGRISRTMNNIMLVIVLGNFQMRRFTCCLHIHGVHGKVGNVFCVVELILCFAFHYSYNYIDYITMLITLLLNQIFGYTRLFDRNHGYLLQ